MGAPPRFLTFEVPLLFAPKIPTPISHPFEWESYVPFSFRCNSGIALPASFLRSAACEYLSASCIVECPRIAMSSFVVAPFSAASVAAASRSPCAEHRGSRASLQRSRNQLPKLRGAWPPTRARPHARRGRSGRPRGRGSKTHPGGISEACVPTSL